MKTQQNADARFDKTLMHNYFKQLVNHFFKILPMRENEDESLPLYIRSLQMELIGCDGVVPELKTNPMYLTLLSVLQYMLDEPGCSVREVRREVFRAISICNKLKAEYAEGGADG